MANKTPLLKISSNLEISVTNHKNIPTENESNSLSDCLEEKQSKTSLKNAVTEMREETPEQDEECLKAERLLKSLLSIDTTEKDESEADTEVDQASIRTGEVSEPHVSSEVVVDDSESNSNDSAEYPPLSAAKTKRRRSPRRRRPRRRKVIQTEEASTTDLEVVSTTSVSKSASSTTCSSNVDVDVESVDDVRDTKEDISIEFIEGSDSAISQDETYQDLITEEFVLDLEQRTIKENLFAEHEKLAKEVAAFELEIAAQLKKSEEMEQSLKQLKADNELLQREKTELVEQVKVKEEEVCLFKEEATSLQMTCDALSQKKKCEKNASYIELDNLKGQLLSKEDELELVKRKHVSEYNELAKSHGKFLAEVLTEAQDINATLYSALRDSAKLKPEIHKTNNVLQLLKRLKDDVLALSDKSCALEINVRQLRDEVEVQGKTLTKVTNDKKLLKEQVEEVSKENKSLVKEKAKLDREKEGLKTEATRAKNMSQSCKVRLEECKASSRSVKRENETLLREKQETESILKSLGLDYKTLLSDRKNNATAKTNRQQNLKSNPAMLQDESNPKPKTIEGSETQNSEEAKKLGTSSQAKASDKKSEQSCRVLKDFITIVEKDKVCLKRLTELIANGDLNVELLVKSLFCRCGCLKDEAMQKQFVESVPWLNRCIKSIEAKSKMADDLSNALEKLKTENQMVKQERSEIEKSLQNYKEMVHGYTVIVQELEENVVGVREMKCINRELEKYSVLLEKQTEGLGTQLVRVHEGMNLIHAMCQRLKSFAGAPVGSMGLGPFPRNLLPNMTTKSLEQTNMFLKEKLAYSEYNLSLLKAALERKRMESAEVQTQIHETLFGNEQRPVLDHSELQKTYKKAKGNGLLGLKKREGDNELKLAGKVETKSPPLSEKQIVAFIHLVQCEEQIGIGAQESIDLEERLERLGKATREYMVMLQEKDPRFRKKGNVNPSVDGKVGLELLKCLKEMERIEIEFYFKEAQTKLLEMQITLLKSERKACLKALWRYDEEMKGCTSRSMVSALARLLSSSAASRVKNSVKKGKSDALGQASKNTVNGSNV